MMLQFVYVCIVLRRAIASEPVKNFRKSACNLCDIQNTTYSSTDNNNKDGSTSKEEKEISNCR